MKNFRAEFDGKLAGCKRPRERSTSVGKKRAGKTPIKRIFFDSTNKYCIKTLISFRTWMKAPV